MRIRVYLMAMALLLSSGFAFSQSIENKFDSLERLVDKISFTQKDESLRVIGEMYEIASEQPNSALAFARTYYVETLFKLRHGITDTILHRTIIEKLESEENSERVKIYLSSALVLNLMMKRDYTEAFNFSLQTLEKAVQINDSIGASKLLNLLGVICADIGLREMAANYYEEALKWIPKNSRNYFRITVKNNLYLSYFQRKEIEDKDVILDSLLSLKNEIDKADTTYLYPLIYISLLFYHDSEINKTYSYLLTIRELYKDNPNQFFINSYNLGIYYMRCDKRDNEKALSYFQEAKNFWEYNNNTMLLPAVYNSMSHLFEDMGNLDSAFFYSRKYQEIADQNNQQAQIIDVHRKYVTTSLESSQDKLIISQSKVDLKNKQVIILVISILGIIIVALSLFVILWQKRKNMRQQMLLKEAETQKLMMNLEKEHAISELQREKLDERVREITSYSLLLSSKNNLLQQIWNLVEQFPSDDETTKDIKDIAENVKSVVKNNLHTEKEWEDFMRHFDKVHPHFFEKLHTQHPGLTRNEIKLCAYIRIGMSIKQIARMLNLMPKSVKMNRYRLKKQLNLKTDEDLDDFIQAI